MYDNLKIPNNLQRLLSLEQVYDYRVIPYKEEGDVLFLITDREDVELFAKELEIVLGRSVRFSVEETSIVQKYLDENYGRDAYNYKKINYSKDFLLKIIYEAKQLGSSDIHIEIFENNRYIRFRIDGKLIGRYVVEKEEYAKIVNKIKLMSNLDISEKRLPQDGRITLTTVDEDFDIRVSTLPTLHGEKVVLRILSKDNTKIHLKALGFEEEELKNYLLSLKKTTGIILISGPTGSGKTTTLYATLKELNDGSNNILTIEDPIEYAIEGINQVQLRENIGLGFTKALRTFLRQDPDIIMVGEIRDASTANMAIRAALTGHLVLATIHTNSAWGTVARLIDMEIPPFLVASTLNISVAQRLIRKLCPFCKLEKTVTEADFPPKFKVPEEMKTCFFPIGCSKCYDTGYLGRRAIYEIIPIDNTLIEKIKNNSLDINSYIEEKGIKTLKKHSLELLEKGETSLEEIFNLLIE